MHTQPPSASDVPSQRTAVTGPRADSQDGHVQLHVPVEQTQCAYFWDHARTLWSEPLSLRTFDRACLAVVDRHCDVRDARFRAAVARVGAPVFDRGGYDCRTKKYPPNQTSPPSTAPSVVASAPASAQEIVVTPSHVQPEPLPGHLQSPLTGVVVPSHCFAIVGPEHTSPKPHCPLPKMIGFAHAGHLPQSHFPALHVHVVVESTSVHIGACPFAVAPSEVQLSPPLTSGPCTSPLPLSFPQRQ